MEMEKGAAQGSLNGPLCFNTFKNYLLFLDDVCNIYNCADDNTSSRGNNVHYVCSNLKLGMALDGFNAKLIINDQPFLEQCQTIKAKHCEVSTGFKKIIYRQILLNLS